MAFELQQIMSGRKGAKTTSDKINSIMNGSNAGGLGSGVGSVLSGVQEQISGAGSQSIGQAFNSITNGSSTSSSSSQSNSQNNSSSSGGSDSTGEIKLVDPRNPTDPVVVFDPTMEKPELARLYVGTDMNESADTKSDKPDANNLKIDGVKIPIIQLNNTAVDFENIEEFNLKLVNFLPEIELRIYDYDDIIKATDSPGMRNTITVILLAPVDGANKKISLEFYITKCEANKDNTIDYEGVMNIHQFRSKFNKQIGSEKLTTYELLEQIAKDTGLGFAATENCKNINDKRFRQLYKETYLEFVQDQLSFAGTDASTVIDAWVDEFGYLVMVNFAWVMDSSINPFQLSIKAVKGLNTGSKQPEEYDNTVEETVRMITNSRQVDNVSNLWFSIYTNAVDNSGVLEHGSNSKYYYLTDPGDTNTIQTSTGAVMEMSMDAINDSRIYFTDNVEFIGINFTDDDDTDNTPILVQRKNIQNYKDSMCNKTITVEMPKANYLLQRGTLVVVYIEESSDAAKRVILDDADTVTKTEAQADTILEDDLVNDDTEAARQTVLFSDHFNGLQNPALSGIYYIKDICFKYNKGDGEIRQVMTLIKKGLKTNIKNYTLPRKQKFTIDGK